MDWDPAIWSVVYAHINLPKHHTCCSQPGTAVQRRIIFLPLARKPLSVIAIKPEYRSPCSQSRTLKGSLTGSPSVSKMFLIQTSVVFFCIPRTEQDYVFMQVCCFQSGSEWNMLVDNQTWQLFITLGYQPDTLLGRQPINLKGYLELLNRVSLQDLLLPWVSNPFRLLLQKGDNVLVGLGSLQHDSLNCTLPFCERNTQISSWFCSQELLRWNRMEFWDISKTPALSCHIFLV